MFKINEAPNIALAAIASHKTARTCGLFWSVLCCLPTCGSTMGLCDEEFDNFDGCCYPHPVSLESNIGIETLIDALHRIKSGWKQKQTNEASMAMQTEAGQHELVRWQVLETVKILEYAIAQNVIQGSYKEIIEEVLYKIRTRAVTEEEYSNVLLTEKLQLTGADVYHPTYGLSPITNSK